ncbi:hypothetical protein PoB_001564500 [Plakobranchus ocellatus]|uniref:Uncharacterized protein n=1 Tax=Plakobranchus ocellatus TaxID=259542 RepID=A0AAV3Z3E6_9GAST|nr:hypothetical protein PoB_001564500 [Plakobranchus ocellatus]
MAAVMCYDPVKLNRFKRSREKGEGRNNEQVKKETVNWKKHEEEGGGETMKDIDEEKKGKRGEVYRLIYIRDAIGSNNGGVVKGNSLIIESS